LIFPGIKLAAKNIMSAVAAALTGFAVLAVAWGLVAIGLRRQE